MIQKKKTDFLRRLEFIEKMISCYFTCPSLRTQRALALGISIEAQTLVAELEILKDKWHTRLPFWEDWDVRFVEWKSKIKSWIDKKDSMYEPYNDTVPYFDTEIFYPLLDSEEDEHNNVLSSAISTIKKDVENFENSEYVGKACYFFGDGIVFDYIFDAALKRLLDAIESCELTLMTPNADAYTELYLYILNNFVKEQKYDVEVQTEKEIMPLPNNNRLSVLKKMFETECDFSDLGKWKEHLQDMLPMVNPETPLCDENMGKFLSRYRLQLTYEDLMLIVPRYYKLSLLNKAIIAEKIIVSSKKTVIECVNTDYCHTYLNYDLAYNIEAMSALRDVVSQVDERASVKQGERSGKWKWGHLRVAMQNEKIKFVDDKISGTDFGRLISNILLGENADKKTRSNKEKAVSQTLKNLGPDFPVHSDDTIIKIIIEMLEPVKKLIADQ